MYKALRALGNLFEVLVVGDAPQGLENRGATCYLNSILQALRTCKFFHQSVLFHSRDEPRFEIKKANETLYNVLKQIPASKVNNVQSDSDEALKGIMDVLTSGEASLEAYSTRVNIQSCFRHSVTSQVECLGCSNMTIKSTLDNNLFFDPLPVRQLGVLVNMDSLFECWSMIEPLTGDNQYSCEVKFCQNRWSKKA